MDDHRTPTGSERAEEPRPDAGAAHLVVRAAEALIALPAANAIEIWAPDRCHPVPGTPPHVIGIATFRGAPVPLIDLATALDLGGPAKLRGARVALDDRRAVLASTPSFFVGLVVDGTLGVLDVTPDQVRRPKVVAAGRLADLATGEIDAPRWGVAAVLDLEAFLDAARVRS